MTSTEDILQKCLLNVPYLYSWNLSEKKYFCHKCEKNKTHSQQITAYVQNISLYLNSEKQKIGEKQEWSKKGEKGRKKEGRMKDTKTLNVVVTLQDKDAVSMSACCLAHTQHTECLIKIGPHVSY